MWLIKTVTTLTKTALFLTGEEGWCSPFPWQGNSHDYPKLHVLCGTLHPHWLQWSWFLTANGLSEAVHELPLFMLLLPQISPSEPTTAAGTQPCHHPRYLSSFHDFYCPPCLCSQAECPISESRFAFSVHRTLPAPFWRAYTIFVLLTRVLRNITSEEKLSLLQLQAWQSKGKVFGQDCWDITLEIMLCEGGGHSPGCSAYSKTSVQEAGAGSGRGLSCHHSQWPTWECVLPNPPSSGSAYLDVLGPQSRMPLTRGPG